MVPIGLFIDPTAPSYWFVRADGNPTTDGTCTAEAPMRHHSAGDLRAPAQETVMSIWAYENWQAYGGKRSVVFHLPSCPSCNHGQGIHAGAGDEHGRWLEFEDLAAATEWADRHRADLVRPCKRCLPTAASSVVSTA